VGFDETNGEPRYLNYPVYVNGESTGVKTEDLMFTDPRDKFWSKGKATSPNLFGQAQCGGGKLIIITEGEKDCLSAWQMLRAAGKEYQVVSLPNGANSRAIRDNLEWLETFETVTLCLDMDKPGQDCAKEIADILSPGKCKIMTLPVKDANEYMLSDKNTWTVNGSTYGVGHKFLKLVWNARTYQPEGVIKLGDARRAGLMWKDKGKLSTPYPWACLNKKVYGQRGGEIVTWVSGTGLGKSSLMRENIHHLHATTTDNIGVLALEETVEETMWGLTSIQGGMRLNVREERQFAINNGDCTEEDIDKWSSEVFDDDRIICISTEHGKIDTPESLLSKMRYLIKGMECRWVVLDHISIVASALASSVDERRALDIIMTKLAQIVVETGAGLHVVCHLRRMDGNLSHEEGREVGLSHLRGTQAIAQLSNIVIAGERNQQAEEEREANLIKLRGLKNRYSGSTGIAGYLAYDPKTGRLSEITTSVEEYLALDQEEAGC